MDCLNYVDFLALTIRHICGQSTHHRIVFGSSQYYNKSKIHRFSEYSLVTASTPRRPGAVTPAAPAGSVTITATPTGVVVSGSPREPAGQGPRGRLLGGALPPAWALASPLLHLRERSRMVLAGGSEVRGQEILFAGTFWRLFFCRSYRMHFWLVKCSRIVLFVNDSSFKRLNYN